MKKAVYPGTFDPLTRGHEDLVRRATGLFSEVIVAIADSKAKRPIFVSTSASTSRARPWPVMTTSRCSASPVC